MAQKHKGSGHVKGSKKVTYAEAAKRLRTIQSLPFKNRTRFTPSQKAYISRQYNEHRSAIRAVKRGDATVIHTSDAKAKALGDHYHRVRGGLVVRGVDSGRVVKRGGRYVLEAREGELYMQFRPLQSEYASRDDVHSLAQQINRQYKAPKYQLMLTIGGVPTTYQYDFDQFMRYVDRLEAEGVFGQKPFDGIMIVHGEY